MSWNRIITAVLAALLTALMAWMAMGAPGCEETSTPVMRARMGEQEGRGDSLRDGAEVARRAHNPEVAGSNPAPATTEVTP